MIELSHKKLDVYKKTKELVYFVYKFTNDFPDTEKYGLVSQIRRSSISVLSNLSEGASRISHQEKKRFFEISRSSLVELDSQLEISIDLGYLNKGDTLKLNELANHVFAMLSNLIKKYEN